jgi:N-acetylmuramoyl-L-alanine amidase
MRVAISSGHSHRDPGAVGILTERVENVRVANELGRIINATPGNAAVVYHDETSTSSRQNVNDTAGWHNRQSRDWDIQIHFNAHSRTKAPRGTEVLFLAAASNARARAVSTAVASAGGFIDRGPKHRTNLGFLNQTRMPALMPEICFVDSSADAELYRRHFDAICQALAASILGGAAPGPQPTPGERPTIRQGSQGEAVREAQRLLGGLTADGIFGPLTDARARQFQTERGLAVDGIIGPRTWGELLK